MRNLTNTSASSLLATNRFFLGIIFLMTGIMKIGFEQFGSAWGIQLQEAQIPFSETIYWLVPVLEVILGGLLLIGIYSRVSAALILPIMLVAIYVHIVVENPAAFPAQPQIPIMPAIVIMMSLFTLIKGAGNWSWDLRVSNCPNHKHN
ncbi:MAG: DoxX family protein [Bacteroidia bacterium]|uniref:DoxX family protein n=1 Tax=Flavobacterium sp. TaxID=239 RepID=UPI0025BE3B3E|nr:DoxX family protein [Flavobacterium sp.]MCK6609274.1 DoxX family protein [Flavobacterium sp.]MCK6648111.1 DoxX family protein [Bacteroidia bacterium]